VSDLCVRGLCEGFSGSGIGCGGVGVRVGGFSFLGNIASVRGGWKGRKSLIFWSVSSRGKSEIDTYLEKLMNDCWLVDSAMFSLSPFRQKQSTVLSNMYRVGLLLT